MKGVCLRACTTLIPPSAANTPELGKQRTCQFSAPRTASVQVNTKFGFNQPCKMPMELYPPTKAICSPVTYPMMDGNGKAICFPTYLDKIPLSSRRMCEGGLNAPVVPPGHRCLPVSLCPGRAALGRGCWIRYPSLGTPVEMGGCRSCGLSHEQVLLPFPH